jgi:hypothetical protein
VYNKFIALSDVSCLAQALKEENIQLHPEDAILARLWANRLKSDNIHISYKD